MGNIEREKLLEDKTISKKEPQLIFVCDWHPNLALLPSILKKHFHRLENNTKSAKIFTCKPTVAFRRPKSLATYLIKNKSSQHKLPILTRKCGKCKLCANISNAHEIANKKKNITIKLKDGGDCRTKELIYAARCKKHDVVCVGHTGETLCDRFSKHRYDIKHRPDNSELAEHFHKDHSEEDLEVLILQTGLKSKAEREYYEDKWICRLQTLQPTGINIDTHQYAKDMYTCFSRTINGTLNEV